VRTAIVFVGLSLAVPLLAQKPKVVMPWEMPCNEEKIASNLKIRHEQRIEGRIIDQTGDPFASTAVELRSYRSSTKQSAYKQVQTNSRGYFDFGTVKPGRYRFLPSPHRGFKQPDLLSCPAGNVCVLNLTLAVNPTDQFYAECPVK